jgi:hypothetical protein
MLDNYTLIGARHQSASAGASLGRDRQSVLTGGDSCGLLLTRQTAPFTSHPSQATISMVDDLELPPTPPARRFDDYWRQSRRPLTSLVFIMPLLVLYEGGVLLPGATAIRNGADVWLRRLLDALGLGHYFLLPVLIVALLLAWHHTTGEPWRVSGRAIYGMYAESALLALALIVLGHLQGSLLHSIAGGWPALAAVRSGGRFHFLGQLVGYFGAGIYEEVLFRLILLPAVAAVLKLCRARAELQVAGPVVLTSLAFSAAHYIGPQGDALQWFSFLFRFLAGAFFALLFVYRGFGIAAGTHALYDIFVGLFLR